MLVVTYVVHSESERARRCLTAPSRRGAAVPDSGPIVGGRAAVVGFFCQVNYHPRRHRSQRLDHNWHSLTGWSADALLNDQNLGGSVLEDGAREREYRATHRGET